MKTLATIIADFSTQLTTQINAAGTTGSIASNKDSDGNTIPDGRYFFTIDGGTSQKEHILCILSGTALTDIQSISRQGVITAGAVRLHRVGAPVIISDFLHIKAIADLLDGTTNLDSSVNLGYDGPPVGLTGNQLATVAFVLSVVNGGTLYFDQQVISNQSAGEALAINDLVYFKEADQRWYKVDADLTATFDELPIGITKSAATIPGDTIVIAISGPVDGFSTLSLGQKYYASNTPGQITNTPGTNSVFIGWALSASVILFDPLMKTIPTQKEKDALQGSVGIPSNTNRYLTQDNISVGGTDQSQLTQDSAQTFGEADATTKHNLLAQSFIPLRTKIRGVNLYKTLDTGTFTGSVTIALFADTAGAPSGSALASVTYTNYQWTVMAVGEFSAIFGAEYSMTTGQRYWIVASANTADNSNHPNLGANSAGGYSNGGVSYKNTSDGWVAIPTIDLYFATLEGIDGQIFTIGPNGQIPAEVLPSFAAGLQQPFEQTLPISAVETSAIASSTDGSVLFAYSSPSGTDTITRYQRDPVTGTYYQTHKVNTLMSSSSGRPVGLAILGSFLYGFFDNGTNIGSYRYSIADLTGETAMTLTTPIPASGTPSSVFAWNDGNYLYVYAPQSGSVSHRLLPSTTFLNEVSVSGAAPANIGPGMMFDGTNIYSAQFGPITIFKFADVFGVATAATLVRDLGSYSPNDNVIAPILINIDSSRMYIGITVQIYDDGTSADDRFAMILKPISKF